MISKELFVETIELMKKKREHENNLISALELCSPQEYVNAFIYSEYETQMVNVLKETFNLNENDDILEWWLWDLDYGKKYKDGLIKDKNGDTVSLKTAEDLYNYLVKEVISDE